MHKESLPIKEQRPFMRSLLFLFGFIVWLRFGLSLHVIGIFEHLGQAQCSKEY